MKAVINIKTNKEIKENAQKIAKDVGLSLSDVINASLRNFIRTREVYFSAIPRMTPEFERLIGKFERDIKNKKNVSSNFSSSERINDYLDNL
ncbi:MAG: type II toxin-antitoxin system RelB/DinJ family antitoxin [Candidatus Pacebacteria bacterium]|nr:type II toxin-antitoxin system RelB/DinJ family antitoxin [Candidatus Paceibacterota bacterium]